MSGRILSCSLRFAQSLDPPSLRNAELRLGRRWSRKKSLPIVVGGLSIVNSARYTEYVARYPFPPLSMSTPIKLPDAMPDVAHPTLLVVCDTHHCRFITIGGHSMAEETPLKSEEHHHEGVDGRTQSPSAFGKGGMISGMSDPNQSDEHRMKTFANALVKYLDQFIRQQKIQVVHFSAPGKFLSVLRDHLNPAIKNVTKQTIDGNFAKESPFDLLARFMPHLAEAVKALHDQENYSPKNRPPK